MKLILDGGTTSKKIQVFIPDSSSTTGEGLTGLVFNSAGLIARYFRDGATGSTSITLAAGTLGTYGSGHFKEIDATNMKGWYEFGIPDAALAVSSDQVGIVLRGATNMAPVNIEIQLKRVPANMESSSTGAITSSSFAAGAINAAAIAADAITAAKIATDAIDGDAIAASAVSEIQSGLATSAVLATVQADTDDIQSRLPATLSGGKMRAQVEGMDADTLTGTALAASAVTEMQTGLALDSTVAKEATSAAIKAKTDGLNFTGADVKATLDGETVALSTASEDSVIDKVWDEPTAGHATAGTTGKALIDASSGASPGAIADAVWDEARAGHVIAGTFGEGVITENLNAPAAAAVLAQANAALDAAIPELPQAQVTATPSTRVGIMLGFMALRNKFRSSSTDSEIYNDAGTVIMKAAKADAGGFYTRQKLVTGP